MKLFKKKNTEYSKAERFGLAVITFFVFAIIGCFVKPFFTPIQLTSLMDVLWQFAPYALGFGAFFSVLSYFYPKFFVFFLIFLPIPN